MQPRFLLLTLAALAPFTGAAEKPDRERYKTEIAATETAFSAMAQEKGILAAFEHFAAPEVAFVDTNPPAVAGTGRGPAPNERNAGRPEAQLVGALR